MGPEAPSSKGRLAVSIGWEPTGPVSGPFSPGHPQTRLILPSALPANVGADKREPHVVVQDRVWE